MDNLTSKKQSSYPDMRVSSTHNPEAAILQILIHLAPPNARSYRDDFLLVILHGQGFEILQVDQHA
jgi:hypothetical protein